MQMELLYKLIFDSMIAKERVKINQKSPYDFNTYQGILIKRIELYAELLELKDTKLPEQKQIEINSIKNVVIRLSNDYYFKQIIIPLFNFDIRKIFSTLLETIEDCFSYNINNSLIPQNLIVSDSNQFELYGFRVLLMYSIVKKLAKDDFLQNNPFLMKNQLKFSQL